MEIAPKTGQELLELSEEPGVVAIYLRPEPLPQKVLKAGRVPVLFESGRGLPVQLLGISLTQRPGIPQLLLEAEA